MAFYHLHLHYSYPNSSLWVKTVIFLVLDRFIEVWNVNRLFPQPSTGACRGGGGVGGWGEETDGISD